MKSLVQRIQEKKVTVGIIGLGYVGLPLVLRFCEAGFRVLGFDVDSKKEICSVADGAISRRSLPGRSRASSGVVSSVPEGWTGGRRRS